MNQFSGTSISTGIGIGTAFVIPEQSKIEITPAHIVPDTVDAGWRQFEAARAAVATAVQSQRDALPQGAAADVDRTLLDSYLLMLDDAVFVNEIKCHYEKNLYTIAYAVTSKVQEYVAQLQSVNDAYLSERAKDMTDIFGRVIRTMLNISCFDVAAVPAGAVVVADDICPADMIVLAHKNIAGLVLARGGSVSHVAIIARTYALPAIFGIADITRYIVNGETMIVDGNSGTVYATPHDTLLNDYRKKYADERIRRQKVRASVSEPAVTKDGTSFALFANIGTVEEARWAQEAGADGIGLFRTEFLYMQEGRAIDEEQQVAAYSAVLKVMAGKPVTIRTLDSGGDKQITVPGSLQYAEKNPLMGLRAIRASLAAPDFFRTQLRALYRASVHGNLRIMVPLVTTVEQVQQCRILAKEVQQELTEKNISYDKSVPFGVMIETPAAAIASDRLAEVSDFFSIGTNDLTQYTLAVDRENTAVAALYDECNISVLRLIARTIEHATTARIPVSVCGELAGRRDGVAVLAGIGVRHMSMNVSCLETVREMLCSSTLADFRLISDGYLNKI